MPLPFHESLKIFAVSYLPLGVLSLYGVPGSLQQTWLAHPVLAIILAFGLPLLVLAYTGPRSVLRPALLPLIALNTVCYHTLSPYVMDTRASAAGFDGPMILLFLGAVDFLLVRRLHLDAEKRERGQGVGAEQWTSRWKWAAHVLWSYRAIGTARQAKNVPRFHPELPSRAAFVFRRALACAGSFVVLDIISSLPPPPAARVSPEAAWLLPPQHLLTADALETRLISTLLFWVTLRATISMLYNAVSIIAVATLLNSPADWPPYFGTVADATTLRDFWGKYWHSGLRNPMVANANFVTYDLLRLSRGTLAARYLSIFLTFAISGAIHHLVDSIAGVPAAENTTADLFLMQAVGITVEDFTVWLFERRFAKVQAAAAARKHGWARVLGYVWVCAWLVWVTPPMSYSHIRYELDRFARPGPVGALIAKLR